MIKKFRAIVADLIDPSRNAAPAKQEKPAPKRNLSAAVRKAQEKLTEPAATAFKVQPPQLMPGVVPAGEKPLVALDSAAYEYASVSYQGNGFPGYPYLSQLATRAEYLAFAAALSTEMTREWLEFTSTESDDNATKDKIVELVKEVDRLGLRSAIQTAVAHDALFGRAQLFIDMKRGDRDVPLLISDRTIKQGELKKIVPVEALWTTPSAYDALDPASSAFYRPTSWFMLGQKVHSSRLLTIITRPVPDMLKPAFNFGGLSLSQLAEPYVNNWLRTRQSVADLINNFSITALATSMDQVLQGSDDGTELIKRAELFTLMRSNRGLMLLDKDREELVQMNTPLSGLHELQAQAQEHMCSVSRIPAMILTGISPSGLNASSDGEVRAWYDWVSAQQEAHWREPLDIILQIVQLSLWGAVDPNISFSFKPLWQMDAAEEATNRKTDADTDALYIDRGVLDPSEVRKRLATQPDSGYEGIDTTLEIVPPDQLDPLDALLGGQPPAPFGAPPQQPFAA